MTQRSFDATTLPEPFQLELGSIRKRDRKISGAALSRKNAGEQKMNKIHGRTVSKRIRRLRSVQGQFDGSSDCQIRRDSGRSDLEARRNDSC